MSNVRLLDCTLRDGGYLNNWKFGARRIAGVVSGLSAAGVDIVECGFLQDKPSSAEQSLYNSIQEITNVLPANRGSAKYVAMMFSGDFDISKLSANCAQSGVFGIRIVFKEHQADAALEECRLIEEKGYKVFLQPASTDAYSDRLLIDLVEKANKIEPYAFSFVDTLGVMDGDDIVHIALLIHKNLKPGIVMGFHSHNNLQLAFSNVQKLIGMRLKRELIVDSAIFGMGRGAGNLHTELVANYINENSEGKYNVDQILRVYDEHIRSLRDEYAWGYSVPYYLAAVHKCHPNYGAYLMNLGTLPVTDIGVMLSRIQEKDKRIYSKEIIEDLYLNYAANRIDDAEAYVRLEKELSKGGDVLLLGPGKSLATHAEDINRFIKGNKPVIIAINNAPEAYPVDFAFYSNRKRFEERLGGAKVKCILTSNIEHDEANAITVDYMTLCNQQGTFCDNSTVLLLSLLSRLGCESVNIAGLDGYSGDDYYLKDMQYTSDREWMENMNSLVAAAIENYSRRMEIRFITPSMYCPTD